MPETCISLAMASNRNEFDLHIQMVTKNTIRDLLAKVLALQALKNVENDMIG